jgi:hypothetical protein
MVAFGAEFGFYTGDAAGWTERYPGTDGLSSMVVAVPPRGQEYTYSIDDEIYRETTLNFLSYLSVGVLLGKDAGIGLGPRAAIRWGRMEIPRAFVFTLHGGYSTLMPGVEADGRVRPFLDADFRLGMLLPENGSLQLDLGAPTVGTSQPVFGLTAGVGTTF